MKESGEERSDPEWTLVTGAGKHLGREIARHLARKGHAVAIHYKTSVDEALDVLRDCRAMGAQAEVIQGSFSTYEETQDFIARYKQKFFKTKYLVYNVGNYIIKKALATDPQESYDLFQTNFHAPFMLIQALAESIKSSKGSIVTIGTSGLNISRADAKSPIYQASKAALWFFTKSLAKDLAPEGVTVNMVSPGQLHDSVDLPKDWSVYPMQRPAQAQEVVRVIEFLLEPESVYITGQNIEVAGAFGM